MGGERTADYGSSTGDWLVTGVLLGDDGTQISGATINLYPITSQTSARALNKRVRSAVTGRGGSFQLMNLLEGTYRVCAKVANSTWLDPCDWSYDTLGVVISRSNPSTSITVSMRRGVAIPIRVDDIGQVMTLHEGKTPGAGLLLTIAGPGLFFRLVPLITKDSGGRTYQIAVPFDTALTLVVHPSFYRVNDERGALVSKASEAKIPLRVARGQQIAPIRFTISGVGQ